MSAALAVEKQAALACDSVDPEVMFPDEELTNFHPDVQAAKRVCLGCSARFECLQNAMDRNEEFGVWGGLTPKERRAMRKRQTRAARGQTETLEIAL